MMGRQDDNQPTMFYKFCLEDHIPADHTLRKVAEVLDFSYIRATLAPHYSAIGRPSIDPELMLRMLVIGYLYGIRSERRLCEEVHVNLAYRWFCRLGLDGNVPERSVFSKTRHGRFRDGDVFRKVFETVVTACLKAGLVGGEAFAIDASTIEADASIDRRAEGAQRPGEWSEQTVKRPIREYLDILDSDAGFIVMEGTNLQPAKALSLTDPAASFRHRPKDSACFGYSTNYLIDRQNAVIVDVEATPARMGEALLRSQMWNVFHFVIQRTTCAKRKSKHQCQMYAHAPGGATVKSRRSPAHAKHNGTLQSN